MDVGAQGRGGAYAPLLGVPQGPPVAAGVLGLAAVLGVAVTTSLRVGYSPVSGVAKASLILPLGLAAAIALGTLALRSFAGFMLAVLAIRSGLDALDTAPGGLGASQGLAVLLIAGALVWLAIRRTRTGPERAYGAVPAAGAALLVAAAISAIGAVDPAASLIELSRMSSAALIFVVLVRLLDDGLSPRTVLAALCAALVVPIALAGWQQLTGHGLVFIDGFGRVHGSFIHPNSLAMFLTLLGVFGVAVLPALRWPARLIVGAMLAASTLVVAATFTRSAWIGLVVGLLVIAFLHARWLIPLILVAAVAASLAVPSIAARWADLEETRQASGDAGNSLVWRIEYWDEAIRLASAQPVTGLGLGMASELTEEQRQLHNDAVRAYVEMGVLGLGAYVWLLLAIARTVRRARARAVTRLERGIATGAAAATCSFVVVSLSDNVISQVAVVWYFAAIIALVTHVARSRAREMPA